MIKNKKKVRQEHILVWWKQRIPWETEQEHSVLNLMTLVIYSISLAPVSHMWNKRIRLGHLLVPFSSDSSRADLDRKKRPPKETTCSFPIYLTYPESVSQQHQLCPTVLGAGGGGRGAMIRKLEVWPYSPQGGDLVADSVLLWLDLVGSRGSWAVRIFKSLL